MKTVLRIGWILLCLTLALTARCWNLRDVFVEGRIYFVDADCYSRMTRVAIVAEHPGTILRHHDFENWPEGTTPHTTSLLDYLILGMKGVVDWALAVFDKGGTSVLRGQTLDLAGAVISPLLGVGGTLFLALWLWRMRVKFAGMALLFYAISPILVHGTLLGRPDHQSLLIFLLTIAGCSELLLAAPAVEGDSTPNKRTWGIVAGVAWGLSLWVSWYEPLVLLVAVCAIWVIADRRALWSPDRRAGTIAGLAIVTVSIGIEHWRVSLPGDRASFANWAQTIGELKHLDLFSPLIFGWLGWTIIAAPVMLIRARTSDRRALPLLALLAMALALTIWQVRWGYFLALIFVWVLPWQMVTLRRPWVAWLIFVAGLWPVLKDWDTRLFPEGATRERVEVQRAETSALRALVMVTAGENAGSILAPWWNSPAIAYWTRNPCVAGSSHESLPGIMDSARFFLSPSPASAATILRKRRVRWVLADDPIRVIENSRVLLGVPPSENAFATTLMNRPEDVPEFLQQWTGSTSGRGQFAADDGRGLLGATMLDAVRLYRLYRVDDAKLPP